LNLTKDIANASKKENLQEVVHHDGRLESRHSLGDRRREEESLVTRRIREQLGDYTKIILEAALEQAIRLIKHQKR